ncbi:MAG TPA: glycoside hydrolase family 97 N-terminal domain-containing protein, partial [Opitutus sp.]|nr:glycoside hydrolase family 97 N-terminal domain-containing protein [Opitutus sp.]
MKPAQMMPLSFRIATFLAVVGLAFTSRAAEPSLGETWTVLSPDQTHELLVTLSAEGRLAYALNRRGTDVSVPVLGASPLGLATDAGRFVDRLKIVSASEPTQVDEAYAMATGKQLALRDRHTAWSLELANVDEHPFAVDFRVYEDGLAFRYRLPQLAKPTARVVGEHSGFRFA